MLVVVVPPGSVVDTVGRQPHSTPPWKVNVSQALPAGQGPRLHEAPPEMVLHDPSAGTQSQKVRSWSPLQRVAWQTSPLGHTPPHTGYVVSPQS